MNWRTSTTYLQRLGDAMALLCSGNRPSDEMLGAWLNECEGDFRLQEFACEHGPAWSQGIVLIDAASLLADQRRGNRQPRYAGDVRLTAQLGGWLITEKNMNVSQALDAADEGEKEGLRGLYPTVGYVLAAEVRHLQERVNQQARFSEKAIEAMNRNADLGEAAERDAARYRWIRGPDEESTRYNRWRVEYFEGPNGWANMQREAMDAAIDRELTGPTK